MGGRLDRTSGERPRASRIANPCRWLGGGIDRLIMPVLLPDARTVGFLLARGRAVDSLRFYTLDAVKNLIEIGREER